MKLFLVSEDKLGRGAYPGSCLVETGVIYEAIKGKERVLIAIHTDTVG
jgi:hypothetical protein